MVKSFRLIVAACGIVSIVLAQAAWADNNPEPVIKLQQVVVTATSLDKKVVEIPASISIITSGGSLTYLTY